MILNSIKSICKSILFAITTLIISTTAYAFTEGKDYMILDTPIPNAQGTLIKVFSYDCPFCYKYDKSVVGPLMKNLGDSIKFVPYHLDTKGTYGKEASALFTVLIVKDQANGIPLLDDKSTFKTAKAAYYKAYHDKKERWEGGAKDYLKTGLDAVGMSVEEFEEAQQDPKVQEMLKAWDASYEIAKIQGVPAFVVNGKYLIFTKSIQSVDSMAKLVRELAAK